MTIVDFLRHGQTEMPHVLAGRTDCALSEEGWRQFERQTAAGAWDGIVSSPLRRAREAAEKLGAARGIAVQIDEAWREIDLGDWEGKTLAELRADAATAALIESYYRDPTTAEPPNGEGWASLAGRVELALDRIAARGGTILVVAHGGSIRTAIARATGIPIGKLWALRTDPASRVRMVLGVHETAGLWGEIIEVVQP
jgi:broad specificity phosphatase PhoE